MRPSPSPLAKAIARGPVATVRHLLLITFGPSLAMATGLAVLTCLTPLRAQPHESPATLVVQVGARSFDLPIPQGGVGPSRAEWSKSTSYIAMCGNDGDTPAFAEARSGIRVSATPQTDIHGQLTAHVVVEAVRLDDLARYEISKGCTIQSPKTTTGKVTQDLPVSDTQAVVRSELLGEPVLFTLR